MTSVIGVSILRRGLNIGWKMNFPKLCKFALLSKTAL